MEGKDIANIFSKTETHAFNTRINNFNDNICFAYLAFGGTVDGWHMFKTDTNSVTNGNFNEMNLNEIFLARWASRLKGYNLKLSGLKGEDYTFIIFPRWKTCHIHTRRIAVNLTWNISVGIQCIFVGLKNSLIMWSRNVVAKIGSCQVRVTLLIWIFIITTVNLAQLITKE